MVSHCVLSWPWLRAEFYLTCGAWNPPSGFVDIDHKFREVLNRSIFNHAAVVMKRILNSYKGLESIKQLGDVGGGPGATLNNNLEVLINI
ncbi:hypothetical protein CUMW_092350 [Citrus unshiu]|nr:hypothetical protein CUMW_092350 [Citrus unshiu]